MFEWVREGEGYEFRGLLEGQSVLRSGNLFELDQPGLPSQAGRLVALSGGPEETRFVFAFEAGLRLEGTLRSKEREYAEGRFELTLHNPTAREIRFNLAVCLEAAGQETPGWLIPALFYKDNRPESNVKRYPRYDPAVSRPQDWVAPAWSFRSDRSSHPGVFVFTERVSACVGTDADTPAGLSGVFLSGPLGRPPCFGLHFPYREEPRTYASCHEAEQKPVRTFATLPPGEALHLQFQVAFGPPELHFYAPVLRHRYETDKDSHPLRPWVNLDEAIALCSEGLYRWHYDPARQVLYETCSFDRYFTLNNKVEGMPYVDRPHMHVGWVSGASAAYGLLQAGCCLDKAEYRDAAVKVLDRIATEGLSPCGLFWSQWTLEEGWGTGWNPRPNWLQGRTAAEAVLFFLKALRLEKGLGKTHPAWEQALRRNLDQIARVQRPDGNLGSYYDCRSGQVEVWEGAGSLLWIAPLVEAAESFSARLYLDVATAAADYYRRFVEDEYIYGAPEDVHLTPTSEDGYNALIAFWALYRTTGDREHLALSRSAADWLLSFRWCYNLKFSPHTLLGRYDFRTRGGDLASPCNQHLHCYGLICLPELFQLAEELGDAYYRERARDHLDCFLQFIAREDGDFGARRGMTPEQFYQTDWWQPKGHLLALAHAWTSGLILYACHWIKENRWEQSFPT